MRQFHFPIMRIFFGTIGFVVLSSTCYSAGESSSFSEVKTFFQTNELYDARLDLAVDGIVVHPHNDKGIQWQAMHETWAARGRPVGRMFFADSDDMNEYWTGKYDGQDHREDTEQTQSGETVMCAGVRPYMVPTRGWIDYLKHKAEQSLSVRASAILPEEPLAHAISGYSEGFKQLWQQQYGSPWRAPDSSEDAWFLACQLKSRLHLNLEAQLLDLTKNYAKKEGRDISFIVPIHSLYSNMAAGLVAPLGTSAVLPEIAGIDGYIGQIWTGPVLWALANYDSPRKSVFGSAYALYDYFCQLTVASDKKLWLLVDPVEDNPNHSWQEFRQWYEHGVTAMLMMADVNRYEVMPWPDRIFLPGYTAGPGKKAPEEFRKTVLAVTQVLQEIPLGGQWLNFQATQSSAKIPKIGIAVADTLMWQKQTGPKLQCVYSLLLPLLERGIPVSSFVMERSGQPDYCQRFDVIVLSYERWIPAEEQMHRQLARWVEQGGVLVVLTGQDNPLDTFPEFWWNKAGYPSPAHHLLEILGRKDNSEDWPFGLGHVMVSSVSPHEFGKPQQAEQRYLPLIEKALRKTWPDETMLCPGNFCMQRGDFIIAHAETAPLFLQKKLINIFDPELEILNQVELAAGQSGVFRDVGNRMEQAKGEPVVLHSTNRLMSQRYQPDELFFIVKGPAETPAVIRIWLGTGKILTVQASDSNGQMVKVDYVAQGHTAKMEFDNNPDGVTVRLRLDHD